MKFFGESLVKLPKLKCFELNLYRNNLENDDINSKILGESL